MECPSRRDDAAEVLIAYVEGTLDPGAQFRLERHLDGCGRCAGMVAAQREVWAALDSWTPPVISPDFDERLSKRIAGESRNTDFWLRLWFARWSWSWRPAMPVAAACAAVVIGFLMRGPGVESVNTSAVVVTHGPQIEQLESALDDMEMLKQLNAPSLSREKM